ncbi:unnamed protein product [Caenorhabditis angaria]|uniref:GAR domain-containing protein n=1 Tax=Caenorhabditis angaria TaxID=860376 RepID=A0A9P1I7V6_9PELO|nr:unnamed protein product [Caenorhabditis angaria]
MINDLGRFKQEIFTSHLTFDPNPQSVEVATKNVQKLKESLDSWRDRIKERLDAIDELCRDEADTLTPEQFAALREKRRLLADEYETVLRNVENIHTRLNILAALLIEFSSLTSSMQSWMTDRTRFGGDIRHMSADPEKFEQARIEAKSLLEEVQREESRLKNIGQSVVRIEKEIEEMYEDIRNSQSGSIPSGVDIEEVHETQKRVEDDYILLLKQCQDLLQFQNRVHSMNDQHAEESRKADIWLGKLYDELDNVEKAKISDNERLERMEELNRMAAGGSSQLDEAEIASQRLLNELEGTTAAEDIRKRHSFIANQRRDKHRDVLDRLQQNMNDAAARRAEAEGVKNAIENIGIWSDQVVEKTKQPIELALNEIALNEAKRDEQVLNGEIESRLAILNQLEEKANDVNDSESVKTIQNIRQKLQRSKSDLKGVRDNIYDALNGLHLINSNSEKTNRAIDNLSTKMRNGRESIDDIEEDLSGIKQNIREIEEVTRNVINIPNVTKTEPVLERNRDLRKRADSCANEIESKKNRMEEQQNVETQFEDAKNRTNEWMNRFEDDIKQLEKVSIEKDKLDEQRKETLAMADRHLHAQKQVDELENIAQKLEDPQKVIKASNIIGDLNNRVQKQAADLKSRGDRINKNDVKSSALKEAEEDVNKWIEKRMETLAELPIPVTKDGVKSQLLELERMDKSGRGEQRRIEEVRLTARELARDASIEKEAEDVIKREKQLAENWENLADQFDSARERARNTEKLLDDYQQIDKWLGVKQKMVDMIGAPNTDANVARTQIGQINLMKVETEGEKQALDNLNTLANELVSGCDDGNAQELMNKMDVLNRRWHSLESGIEDKSNKIEEAAKLGDELRQIYKQLKNEIGELESNVEKASTMSPNDVREQLSTLDNLKLRFGGVDKALDKLKQIMDSAEDLEVDATNRAEIKENLEATQKKADEIERKIDNVKKAALNAQNQGVELEQKLDDLLGIVNMAENELGEVAPICADKIKLDEELKRSEEIYKKLIDNDGDVSLLKAKLGEELKKTPDQNLKKKLDELNGKWGKVVNAARDRKDTVSKVGELVKQFNDGVETLEQRLKGDEDELESLMNDKTTSPSEVCDALKLVEMTMARRLADVDAINSVMNRIEQNAPGADANRLRRKADKLADDCNGISKKARQAAVSAQRQQDFRLKFDRLVAEVQQFVDSQKEKIESATENDQMNQERVQSKLNEVEDFWSLKHRELKSAGEEIKKNGTNEDSNDAEIKIETLESAIAFIIDLLKQQSLRNEEKKDAADRIQLETQKAGQKINSLIGDIGDLDPIGRSRDELKKQKEEIKELVDDLDSAETKLIELGAEWDASLDAGIVTKPVYETNKATTDELNKLAARARKRLGQREKKLEDTENEIDKLHKDAQEIVNELEIVGKNEILAPGSSLLDPKSVSEKVKLLKESMKPIGEKMENFNSDCKLMIKTAGPEGDTSELDGLLKKVGNSWSEVVGKVGDKEMNVDAAVQQQGKVEDAYRSLMNWLEETEEMLENQKKPSADAKVAKAQLHAYEVLMKHVEDKQTSIDGFANMIGKINGNEQEEIALKNKNDEVKNRYSDLLENAQERQRKLLDSVDLAERLQEVVVPFENWLNSAEKRLNGLSKIPISVEKAENMIKEQAAIQDELEFKCDDLKSILEIAPLLSCLVSVEDANSVSGQVQQLEHRARILDNGVTAMRPLIEEFLQQIQDFTLDSEDLAQWLDETKIRLGELDELPIAPDDLVEQSNILGEIGASIADRYETVTSIIEVGTQLAIQGDPEEAILVQRNIDSLKFRYSDLTSSADEKIALLAKAIPLSEMFHNGFDGVMEWLEVIEQDLQQIDEEDAETQADQIFYLEEDISKWRPEVDELTAISTQLQALCSPEKADELLQNTVEMNKMVNSVADRVSRRAERIEMQKKQSRAVLDDLCYLVDWFVNARDRIDSAGQLSLDPEYLRTQLKHQKLMNDDVNSNKGALKNVSNEAKKVVRQLGAEGTEANAELLDKCEQGKELVDEVTQLCLDRTETLEKGLVLTEQLADQFDGLNEWLDQMDEELQNASNVTTATPANELRQMHDHNSELAQQMIAYRPIIDGLKENVKSLQEICGEREAESLGEISNDVIGRYEEMKEIIRGRGQAIDNTMNATIGFGERLETLVANLQGAADRLKENEGISADPSVLESRLAENIAIRESLRDKQNAYDALKQTANELLANIPNGDASGGEVENKLERLDKLWREIEKEAEDQGGLLEDVLGKSKKFWNELDACQKAVDDLRTRLELIEPATGSPEQLADQQDLMTQVAHEMERTKPRIDSLSHSGNALSNYVSPEEKSVIEAQVDNVQGGFSTITALFAEKKRDLIAAIEEAMMFHEDLKALLGWLEKAENYVANMTSVESAKQMNEIAELLDQLHKFKDEVDEKGISKEQLVSTANQLVIDSPPHLAANVKQPINELNGRWTRLYAILAEREHKLESSMLQMGKLTDAIDQLTAWMDKTRGTLVEISPPKNGINLRDVEIAQCKLVVISNDIHAHQNSVDALNQYKNKKGIDRETIGRLNEMNLKWEELQKLLAILSSQIEKSKREAENVGGEVEKWQAWLDEIEAQLLSTKPTGGLPETAEQQLDEFRILKADVEQNSGDIQRQLDALSSNEKDDWMDKTYNGMKIKWAKIGELLVDREKKLELAYEQAVQLENSLNDMEQWIVDSERKLSDLPPISRLPETVDKQLSDHETWMDEVALRKQQMGQHQATGVRMQYYCEKKDAIPIKNRLVSLKHRCEKISTRTAERAKQLIGAKDEVGAWQDGIHELDGFIIDILERIGANEPMTSSLEKLKVKLEEVKEAQKDVSGKQALFDLTRKRGNVLAEHATRNEYKIIASQNEKIGKRWNEMMKKLRDRLREVEQGVLEGGAFEESMNDLEGWVDGELNRYLKQEEQPVYGDIDNVRILMDDEKRRGQERKNKENGIKMIVKKADGLLANGAEESETIKEAKDRLVDKWDKIEELARKRGDSIKDAGKEAEDFDAKTHALLDWLAVEEQKLKAPVTNVKKAIADVENIKSEMKDAKPNYESCIQKGAAILEKCQPAAEQTLKNWIRVVEARWKEVNEKVDEKEFGLLEDEQKEKEKDELIAMLAKFAALKREQLNRMIDQPLAQDLDTIDKQLKEMSDLDFELREKQGDIDSACKTGKKGGPKNVAADMLSNEWKKIWLDAMGLQSTLDAQKELLEEMKRLEGWKWEDWKERYVEWNDHAKARVSDLFRRIDRLHTGNVPRQVFIDGIIGSKFPTSRLEMEKVADLFDKGDGMINSKEFINALRFDSSNRNAKPQTDTEKITHEIERQKKTCSCCQPYQIEKISDNHYRFGDTHIKRMVRILRSTVMVRVGGGWESLDEFLHKHDPCRAKGRLNINMFPESKPNNALDSMRAFTKNRHAKDIPSGSTPGPIMKIREKTDRSVPMSGGLGGTAGYTPINTTGSRIPRAPSDLSAGRLSAANSRGSLADQSRPSSRASSDDGKQSRIPSLRMKKGQRYNPPSTPK